MGLLRIRAMEGSQKHQRCAIEADHVHNLPNLLVNYEPELLDYYWNAERVFFVQRSTDVSTAAFEPLWSDLEELMGSGTVAGAKR